MRQKGGYVYVMANKLRTVIYIGITSDLISRVSEHKDKIFEGFTSRYNCIYLIYYEYFNTIDDAIAREKQLKRWKRCWKESLIKKSNPQLKDLWEDIEGCN